MSQENNTSDEVNLMLYGRILFKRKRLLFSVVLIVVLSATILNLTLPKIYRGEFFMKMKIYDYADIYKTLKFDSPVLRKKIFLKTNDLITDVKLTVFGDTVDWKLYLVIESKDTAHIVKIVNEFADYMNNTPYQKKYLAEQRELLQTEISEYSASIDYINEAIKSHPPGSFGVRQLLDQKIDLARKKMSSEITLKNLSGTELIMQEVYSSPVKPAIVKNIILSVIVGFFLGMLSVYFVEVRDRIKGTSGGNQPA